MTQVYIGLGSNRSHAACEPLQQLQAGLSALANHPQIQLLKASRLYSSSPVGPQDQPDYVNAVACVDTQLSAEAVLDALQAIEKQQGRERTQEQRWGPRSLDLDILLYANQLIETPRLSVPHPQLTRRAFVLYPLVEIAPQLQIPEVGSIAEVLAKFEHSPLAAQQVLKSL